VIDVKTLKMTGRYKMEGCMGPSGLAFIPGAKLLISSCRKRPGESDPVDTGKEVASLPIGRGPDAVIYDPVRKLAFITCGGDGVIEVISVADRRIFPLCSTLPRKPDRGPEWSIEHRTPLSDGIESRSGGHAARGRRRCAKACRLL